ncbi:MAG: hypothetical protein JSU00_26670 [Acidobacteria bacterium]|nr:hypothetical protein [Acidobacteriota bacterium]
MTPTTKTSLPVHCNIAEIHRGIDTLFVAGDVIEVRIPKCGQYGTVSGYFDNFDSLASALARADERYRPQGIYYTINPVLPALLARACNRLRERADLSTSDADILRRRWLPIDLDPVRPAGISSTDEEHEAALTRARDLRSELAAEGWGPSILADSGNGAHVLFRIDYANDAEALRVVASVLGKLSDRYSDDRVKVDVTSANAARIWKAYGTMARKGDPIPVRPHRLSRVLEVPCNQ